MSLCADKKACKVTWYDWSELIDDKDKQSQYSIVVKNKFSPLIPSEDGKQTDNRLGLSADHIYNVLVKAYIDAANETILRMTKCKKDAPWQKTQVVLAWEQFKLAQNNFQENPNKGNEQCLNSQWVNLYATYDQEKQNMISKKLIEIE